jgi:inner membrane protein
MDPITQGALGASLPQSVSTKDKLTTTTWLGCLSGMAPDIDVFIRSPTDPLLFLEFHRQFTHSLIFIPVGALICCLLFYRWSKTSLNLKQSYLVCFLAYSTHAVLDACTTYGTQLFWPFSDVRIAWNNVSVIDPFVTIPLLALVIASYRTKKPMLARLGIAWVLIYLGFGVIQRDRAEAFGQSLAHSRGHQPVSLEARPSFGNLLVWKIIYEYEDRYYADAIRASWQSKVYPGESIDKLDIRRDLPWLDPGSQQARDLNRFDWFSGGYLAMDESEPNLVIDMRYSIVPNQIEALWGIVMNPNASDTEHVGYRTQRNASAESRDSLMQMYFGE